MSFGAGYHTDDFALVAVDMSHGSWGPIGGKLLTTGQGWATLCGDGDARIGAMAARKVAQAYKGADPERWAALLKSAMEQVSGSENIHDGSIVAPLFAHMRDGRPTFDMAISDGRFMSDYTRGMCYFGPTYGVEQERLREEESRVHGVEDPWEAIRQLAAGFEAISEASDVVSRHVHIAGVKLTPGGHTKFHLFGDPQELQASSEERLRSKAWTPGPSKTPGMKWDRDDWGDVPEDIRDQTGFTGDNMPRDPGGSSVATVQDASRMGAADLISEVSFVLFWSDTDTDNSGGIVVGARSESSSDSNPGDFDVQMGGESKTVPGSTEPASAETPYHVYWVEGDASISISTTKSDAIGYDRVYLGRITTGQDETGGGSDPGGSVGGDGDDRTLK